MSFSYHDLSFEIKWVVDPREETPGTPMVLACIVHNRSPHDITSIIVDGECTPSSAGTLPFYLREDAPISHHPSWDQAHPTWTVKNLDNNPSFDGQFEIETLPANDSDVFFLTTTPSDDICFLYRWVIPTHIQVVLDTNNFYCFNYLRALKDKDPTFNHRALAAHLKADPGNNRALNLDALLKGPCPRAVKAAHSRPCLITPKP